ncbi:MAG: hypothetical protein LUG55_00155 [Clostridiales bacterium]|nr:hypothetical protein [Clostridiales bacterium]
MEQYRPGHYMDFSWQMCYANDRFDVDWFRSCASVQQMKLLGREYPKYKDDPMASYVVNYWQALGVTKDFYPCDLETAPSRRDAHHYSALRPAQYREEAYPVVYFCHGGGQDAFDAETYGMAERIPQDGFLYVCPNHYGPEEFDRILGEMAENGYPIDQRRIYVMGFSGGSGSAAEIALAYPERVAGVALFPGPNAFNQMDLQTVPQPFLNNPALRVPVLCMGGTCDGGDNWPLVDDTSFQNLNHWMESVSRVPGYQPTNLAEAKQRMAQSKSQVERVFGLGFDRGYVDEIEDTYCYVGDYMAEDGVALARFCSVAGLPHGVFPMFLGVAWAFLSKFSRNTETGTLEYPKPEMDFRTRRVKKEEEPK